MSQGSNRQCMVGYARILGMLSEPMTSAEMQAATGMTRDNAGRLISEMHRSGLIRIIDWKMEPGKVVCPVYVRGSGNDAAMPLTRPDGRPCVLRKTKEKPRRPNFLAFLSLIRCLEVGNMSRKEVAQECGINRETARNVLIQMKRAKLIYRSGWDTSVRPYVELFTLGNKSDAKKPPAMCRNELNRMYRARRKELETTNLIRSAFAANDERQAA